MSITIHDYFMGRDAKYPLSLTPSIQQAAERTVELANMALDKASEFGIGNVVSPITMTQVSSGWRPPQINSATPGAAPNSKHMTGEAIDLYDPDGDLDEWFMAEPGRNCLEILGLWMEHPAATKGWCHLQTVPPRSGNRVFYP